MHRNTNERRPRVLVSHPSAELYGSDRVLLETIDGLRDGGADVVLAVPSAGPLTEEAEQRGAQVEICPSPVLRKSYLNPRGLIVLAGQALVSTVRTAMLIRRVRPDAVYVNTITIPLWVILGRTARLPTLVHIHEAEGNAPLILRRAMSLPLVFATALVANSVFSRDVLASSFPKLAQRADVIANGVVGPSAAVPAREYLVGPVRLAYVGRLSHRKGVDLVLEAAGLLIDRGLDVTVSLIGSVYPGNESYEEALQERAHRPDLEGRVTFLGFRSSVWAPLADSDVVIVPSRADEPFGNTAVEAVLAQRPAVVSLTSGLVEASSGFDSTIRVTPDSAAAIADAVERIVAAWPQYSEAAAKDALLAAERNGTHTYRKRIASAVLDLLPVASRDRRA